jgi:hypothetical protein
MSDIPEYDITQQQECDTEKQFLIQQHISTMKEEFGGICIGDVNFLDELDEAELNRILEVTLEKNLMNKIKSIPHDKLELIMYHMLSKYDGAYNDDKLLDSWDLISNDTRELHEKVLTYFLSALTLDDLNKSYKHLMDSLTDDIDSYDS